jgi:pimeloyl-ACP methyl ester carboxylesterase
MTQLVFVPGLAADAVMWQPQLNAIPAQFQPAVTDVHMYHATLPEMATALLQEHSGDLILCGASMGGMLAMEAVRQAPQRIKALALLGTTARPETEAMRDMRQAAIILFEQGRAEEVLAANLALAFHPSQANDRELRQTYLEFVLRAGADQLIRQNRALMARPDARLHLSRVSCPTLVLCGDADQLTPPDCSREIAQLINGAEFKLVPQCGHMLTMERPAEVNAALLTWLASIASPSPGDVQRLNQVDAGHDAA